MIRSFLRIPFLTLIPLGMDAVILWIFWGWFLVPLGAPKIGVAHATGICLLIAVFQFDVSRKVETFKNSPEDDGTTEAKVRRALFAEETQRLYMKHLEDGAWLSAQVAFYALILGYIVHKLM